MLRYGKMEEIIQCFVRPWRHKHPKRSHRQRSSEYGNQKKVCEACIHRELIGKTPLDLLKRGSNLSVNKERVRVIVANDSRMREYLSHKKLQLNRRIGSERFSCYLEQSADQEWAWVNVLVPFSELVKRRLVRKFFYEKNQEVGETLRDFFLSQGGYEDKYDKNSNIFKDAKIVEDKLKILKENYKNQMI